VFNSHFKPTDLRKRRQRQCLAVALALLAFTLLAVVLEERDFWFSSDEVSDVLGPEVTHSAKPTPNLSLDNAADKAKAQVAPKQAKKQGSLPKAASEVQPAESEAVATERTVLPPLDVEIVAGDKHSTIHPGRNPAEVIITDDLPAAPATNAAERAPLSTTIPLTGPLVGETYPLLAQQMKVQASVVLQARIGADGVIQDLRVLAGPAILSVAAREAVRPWRFKPYLLNGLPVDTTAKITVNFVIRVADTSVSGN
jgi:TonB family protein